MNFIDESLTNHLFEKNLNMNYLQNKSPPASAFNFRVENSTAQNFKASPINIQKLRAAAAAKYKAHLLYLTANFANDVGARPEQITALKAAAEKASQSAFNPKLSARVMTPPCHIENMSYSDNNIIICVY